jgi:hypothetical protein
VTNISQINLGYAVAQFAKALKTAQSHPDSQIRALAQAKMSKWLSVLAGLNDGNLTIGSRTPVQDVPAWATLEVVTGGFATGQLLAGGQIQDHETTWLEQTEGLGEDQIRQLLNHFFLTDEGLLDLQERLKSGCYQINVPEEGALLIFAWLVQSGHLAKAQALLEMLQPWMNKLRFYPVPTQKAKLHDSHVYLQSVEQTIVQLQQIQPNRQILLQREVILVWKPLYDRMITLFLETVIGEIPYLKVDTQNEWRQDENKRFPVMGDYPCQQFSEGWKIKAQAVIDAYEKALISPQRLAINQTSSFQKLLECLQVCIQDSRALTGRDVGRIRLILARHIHKHGIPDSLKHQQWREKQTAPMQMPTHHQLTQVLISRLKTQEQNQGLEDTNLVTHNLNQTEAQTFNLPFEFAIPSHLQRKVKRASRDTIASLVRQKIIRSAETMARVLPQMTSQLRASGLNDPELRNLYSAIDRAFRQRRSLLLLDLQHQVRLEELPWIQSIQNFRKQNTSDIETAHQALVEISSLTLNCFPQAIIPNKLLGELNTLSSTANLKLPLVEELAVDIFMGKFSKKFLEAAKSTTKLLSGTLYSTYYGIDTQKVQKITNSQDLLSLCETQAGVKYGGWNVVINGMIIEQQQILCSHNLAVLYNDLHLNTVLLEQSAELATRCFVWLCQQLQLKFTHLHARLIQLKNSAYAWRQMLFFLALLPKEQLKSTFDALEAHYYQQPLKFIKRFQPAMTGLKFTIDGMNLDSQEAVQANAKRFLGWTNTNHWLF